MAEESVTFPQEFFNKHLSLFKNISFTSREIDVMACLFHARRTSKIAYFLSINPRTVETHIRNIMVKLDCNTRERIIDFIESSDKISLIRTYYSLLQNEEVFNKSLKDITKLTRGTSLRVFLMLSPERDSLESYLEFHLGLSGFSVSSGIRLKQADYLVVILPKSLTKEDTSALLKKITTSRARVVLLIKEKNIANTIPQELKHFEKIDFTKEENYYFSFFSLVQMLQPNLKLDEILFQFKEKYKKILNAPNLTPFRIDEVPPQRGWRKYSGLFLFFGIALLLGAGLLFWPWEQNHSSIRSDLILPQEASFIPRPALSKQLNEGFKESGGIQTIALVGPGGSGKTTFAREFARQKNETTVWEVNAETQDSLRNGFESLAQALANTEKEHKLLSLIQQTPDLSEKEDRIIQFVKDGLRAKQNWFLIFDNVEKFNDIHKYFPYDKETWGEGKVILTTRDANIGINRHVNYVIPMGGLSSSEKFTLFKKIMGNEVENNLSKIQPTKTNQFLESIPPLPLDIVIAAYYLKTTQMPYETYLKNLSQINNDFVSMQETLLKETGDYTQTRYGIITFSLEKIIEENKDFKELLLFMFLLDSQNIPKVLLENFKNESLVDNFIFNLKKYSLLTDQREAASIAHLSIHRSTQDIGLAYLIKSLGKEKTQGLIKLIAQSLEGYIDEVVIGADMPKMKLLINPCESLIVHKDLLHSTVEAIIKGELGIIYYFFSDNIKAKSLLEESLLILNKEKHASTMHSAMFTGYLGNVFRDLGDYEKARLYLKNSLSMYSLAYPSDELRHAYFFVYLGIIERYMGNYKVAKIFFEEGLILHQKYFSKDRNYPAWAYGQMGIVERELGNYEEAKTILEQSLTSFKTHRTDDHVDIAWALEHLGVIYLKLGDHEKAKKALEYSLKFYSSFFADPGGPSWVDACLNPIDTSETRENIKKRFIQVLENNKNYFQDNYIYITWPLHQLANVNVRRGNYEKARILLEQVLTIYETNYGSSHLEVARILNDLAQVYFAREDLRKAEELTIRALKILQHYNHPETYISYEALSHIYLKRAQLAKPRYHLRQSQDLKAQAIAYLKQALEVAKAKLPQDSPHIQRLEDKLKSTESFTFKEPPISEEITETNLPKK